MLSQHSAIRLLKKYKICYPKTVICEQAHTAKLSSLKPPLVLKVDAQSILHKSDAGFVITNIESHKECRLRMKKMSAKVSEPFHFVVQEMVSGTELMIGMKRDPTFGPVIVFGLGGIFVEVLKDISMRIAPLTRSDCVDMIEEIKGQRILGGYRGKPAVDQDAIIELLLKMSRLAMHESQIKEIDFNPALANGKKIIVVDARLLDE